MTRKIEKLQAENFMTASQFIEGINKLAALPTSHWEAAKAYVDALHVVPGSQLEIETSLDMFVVKPTGERVFVGNFLGAAIGTTQGGLQ